MDNLVKDNTSLQGSTSTLGRSALRANLRGNYYNFGADIDPALYFPVKRLPEANVNQSFTTFNNAEI